MDAKGFAKALEQAAVDAAEEISDALQPKGSVVTIPGATTLATIILRHINNNLDSTN